MDIFIKIAPVAFILVLVFSLIIGYYFKLCRRFNCRVFAILFVVGFAGTCFMLQEVLHSASGALKARNTQRLIAWEEASCVSPDVIAQSVFIFRSKFKSGLGTSFLLEGGTVVTNRHVGEECPVARLTSQNGSSYITQQTYISNRDTNPDIAFYKAVPEMAHIPYLALAGSEPELGEMVMVVGHNKFRNGFYPSIVKITGSGVYKNAHTPATTWMTKVMARAEGWYRVHILKNGRKGLGSGVMLAGSYIYDGDTASGNSGSPVVNCQGEVVGVHFTGRHTYLFSAERYGAAVTLDGLKAELSFLHTKEIDQLAFNDT